MYQFENDYLINLYDNYDHNKTIIEKENKYVQSVRKLFILRI
jgi:hypothetical protein